MVKSHVDCSPDLTWALVQKQNVFVRRSRSATRQKAFRSFSAEKNNLYSLHTFKFSGIASPSVGIHATAGDKNPTAVTVSVGETNTSVKGIFQQQAKAVVGLCGARKDLQVPALARLSAVQKSCRVAKASK